MTYSKQRSRAHLHSELGLGNCLAFVCRAVLSPQHPTEAIPVPLLPVPSSTTPPEAAAAAREEWVRYGRKKEGREEGREGEVEKAIQLASRE